MTRVLLVCLLLLGAVLPAQAQGEDWCVLFDFTVAGQGWATDNPLTENKYGRYTAGIGFTVSDYGATYPGKSEITREIRIHRDFSGQITQLAVFAQGADYDHIILDYDSNVGDSGGDSFSASPAGVSPDVYAFPAQTVSGRMGIEFINASGPLPTQTIIMGLALSGVGANPFGDSNCNQGINAPIGQIYQTAATASAATNNLPVDLTAPNGVPLLPSESGGQLFSYVKWLITPATADALFGPFAPLFQHLGLGFGLLFALTLVYFAVYAIEYVVRFAIWLFKWLLRILDFALQVIQAGVGLIADTARVVFKIIGALG